MIFTVLKEDDTIWQKIWSWKGDFISKKSMSILYKN